MTDFTAPHAPRALRWWLTIVAALIAVMVLVGGATRLTESGLSIVEWKPIAGTLPPLTDAQWREAFEGYKTIPQYRELNAGMSLEEFKTIFWWEWSHRLLGRVIGIAYLLPFLWFLWRGAVPRNLRPRLWVIFGLGALQGGVGWWMVSSGLAQRIDVSQYRLALHLTLACILYVATLWTAVCLGAERGAEAPGRARGFALALLVMVLAQIYLGAHVAGLDAGLSYNTWPLIDGSFVPDASDLFASEPAWRNLFENRLTVQFDHRMMAYALFLAAFLHLAAAMRTTHRALRLGAIVLAGAVMLQAILGIATLLHQAPLGLALAHQAMAIAVLTIATVHAAGISAARVPALARPVAAEARP
jgi:cytochrome c oxidase assembly protein subunit 15